MRVTKKKTTWILVVALLIGLSLILYPSVSDYWNSIHQSRLVTQYSEVISELTNEEYDELWKKAEDYNESLRHRANEYALTEEQESLYSSLLKTEKSDVLGYVEIPSIQVVLPVYHGTSEGVLQSAIGHLEWTSLPIGGESTHSVLSGHRGLPSAKLFTDLDELVIGDIFMIQVLDRTLTYEVDQIKIVEPGQATDLVIQEGMDLCTLVTCTPYGVNTHRLLVRGHRIENRAEAKMVRITSEASQVEPKIVAIFLGIPMLLILVIVVLGRDERKMKKASKKSMAELLKKLK